MSKAVLISLLIVSLVSSTSLRGADSSSGNYDDLAQFLTGFMTGYTGTAHDMSTCLPPAAQAQLDHYLASTYGYLITEQYAQIKVAYENFLQTLAQDCAQCGLGVVASSLQTGLAEKSKVWYEVNIIYNIPKIESTLESVQSLLKSKKFNQAGLAVGQLTAILIPYEAQPNNKLREILSFSTVNYQNWWKGLLNTLEINPSRPGPCYKFLSNFANTTIPMMVDISKIHDHDRSGYQTLFGDTASTLQYIVSNYPTDICDFQLLYADVTELFSKQGLLDVVTRYASKASAINQAMSNIENCYESAYACGQGYGEIIRYIVNWSIN